MMMRAILIAILLFAAVPALAQQQPDACASGDVTKCQLQVTQEALLNAIITETQLEAAARMAKVAPKPDPEKK